MALQKTIEIGDTGVTASYWRINRVYADIPWNADPEVAVGIAQASVEGWVDQAAYDAGKAPVPGSSRIYVQPIPDPEAFTGFTLEDAYAFLLTLPEFTGSVEV